VGASSFFFYFEFGSWMPKSPKPIVSQYNHCLQWKIFDTSPVMSQDWCVSALQERAHFYLQCVLNIVLTFITPTLYAYVICIIIFILSEIVLPLQMKYRNLASI
jgi:hypothetical protein